MNSALEIQVQISLAMKKIGTLLVIFCAVVTAWGQQSLTPEQVLDMHKKGESFILIDARSPVDFQSKHIEGAINVMRPVILKAQLPKTKKLVLYCGSATCGLSHAAAKDLIDNGYQDVMVLEGGIAAWQAKSYPTVTAPVVSASLMSPRKISARELNGELGKKSFLIVDVRPIPEYRAGHITGAVSIPLEGLPDQITSFDSKKQIVLYDKNMERSGAALKQLQARGLKAAELSGGIQVWVAMKFPISI